MTTALQIIQSATAEMGLSVPSVAVGNSSTDTIQQLALLNALGGDLLREYIWQSCDKEYRFTTQYVTTTGATTSGSAVITGIPSTSGIDATYMVIGTGINQDSYVSTVDSATQVTMVQGASASGTVTLNFCKVKYSMPSDFDRPIDRTQWDKTKHWEMLGPRTSQEWQWLKSGYIATGPRINWRYIGGYFEIWPAVTSADYLGFEYMSKSWVSSSAGVAKTSITADTDVCIFPDRLLVCGLKMKYFEVKGFDTSAYTRDYSKQLSIAMANDAGSKTLSMAPRPQSMLLTGANVPDSGFGL